MSASLTEALTCGVVRSLRVANALFELLDANRDGKLGVREMRSAVALLERYDLKRSGHLTRTDLPRSYRLTLRRGPAGSNPYGGLAAIYGHGRASSPPDSITACCHRGFSPMSATGFYKRICIAS